MSQSVATSRLVSSGFSVDPTVDQQFSESAIAGTIITTRPGARSHLLGGDRVTLVISKGPERYVVPQTAGTTFDQAQQALTAAPVQVVRSDAADDKVPAGQVIRTDPPAGTRVRRSQPITVFVSTGPPVVTVPDVTNKSRSDAGQILQKAGFTASFTDDYSDTVPTGAVISESPQANSRVQKFSVINVVLSKGPSSVTIPDIQGGADPGEAKAALESLGLKVNIVKKDKGFFDFSGYVVDRVDPAPGIQVRRGSSVVLRLK
jgi:serine/threonine-protein kinase